MKEKKSRLSRKAKTLIYTSVVMLALTAIIASNFPVTPRSCFRSAEKAHLLKPAKIISAESVVSVGQQAVIIAETDEFYITYGYRLFGTNNADNLAYKKKTGDLTFLSIAPQSKYDDWDDEYFTIFLFDEYPQAIRAELALKPCMEFSDNGTKTLFERSFTVTATRETEKYFLFRLNWRKENASADTDTWFRTFILMSHLHESLNDNSAVTHPVTGMIRLYDKANNLVLEREIDLKNPNPQ